MPRIIVFDVNETLLDIGALEPHFVRAFGDHVALREWFNTVLLYSEVVSLAGPYADFGALGAAALDMTAGSRGISLMPEDRERILTGTRSLPPHPDVRDGLRRLKDAGFRTVTLTNSAPATVEQQLRHAGLDVLFERVFSVDALKEHIETRVAELLLDSGRCGIRERDRAEAGVLQTAQTVAHVGMWWERARPGEDALAIL